MILGHAEILEFGRKAGNMHAKRLGSWLEDVESVRNTAKILLTSEEPLEWLKEVLIDLNGLGDSGINSVRQRYIH